ncbi:MAG: hypothetical protein AAGA01_03705 [Cyanobacteria bacterium P01_E01_bin.43]
MSSSGIKPFENNWAYLKTELRWLDRVLMMSVSRKRQDDKTLHRVANNAADKVTSHWWKGIIAVDRGIHDREGPPPKGPSKIITVSYSQQLEARIQAGYQAGVVLALPLLRDRLQLSEVEKNIVLMAIAPEINRRYGRLYDYLQEEEGALADLPTVDLCLRLLCRNDHDWQQARAKLTAAHSLVNQGLLEWIGDEDGTLLSQQVRVSDELGNFLLADNPTAAALETVLSTAAVNDIAGLTPENPAPVTAETAPASVPEASHTGAGEREAAVALPPPAPEHLAAIAGAWETLVLPKKLIRQLQYVSRQAQQRRQQADLTGLMVLLVGATGTGKTLAAATLATQGQMSLTCVDLQTLSPEGYPRILTDSPTENASLLLVKQGEQWFGRQSQVEQSWLHQWWQWRQQFGLTLVTVTDLARVRPSWRQQFDTVLTLPQPQAKARHRLWQQAFAPEVNIDKLNWAAIAQQLPLTGGEIQAIAQTIQLDLQARGRHTVTLSALRDALQLHHPHFSV